MGWGLTRWIVSVRSVQLLGAFIPGALNGWLLHYIYSQDGVKLAHSMIVLQILIALLFFYTLLSLLVMHGYKGSQRPGWLAGSVCFDVVFCFLAVAIVSILAYTGLPSNCGGLSETTPSASVDPEDDDNPFKGYNKTDLSDMQGQDKGSLDGYCGMERAFYFITMLIILSYIITIILSVIRVCQLRMHSKDEVEKLLQEREEMINLEHKIHDQEAASTPAQNASPVAPQSNGAFPTTNIRSNTHPCPASRTTTYHTTPSSSSRPARPGLRYADSMSGPSSSAAGSSSSSYRTRPPAEPVSPLSPQGSPLSATAPLPHDRGFILSATDVSANLAMVADGPRYAPSSHHQQADNGQLPPYSPGDARAMRGHGGESNDIRLSEYVKGATAAQDMKDSSGF